MFKCSLCVSTLLSESGHWLLQTQYTLQCCSGCESRGQQPGTSWATQTVRTCTFYTLISTSSTWFVPSPSPRSDVSHVSASSAWLRVPPPASLRPVSECLKGRIFYKQFQWKIDVYKHSGKRLRPTFAYIFYSFHLQPFDLISKYSPLWVSPPLPFCAAPSHPDTRSQSQSQSSVSAVPDCGESEPGTCSNLQPHCSKVQGPAAACSLVQPLHTLDSSSSLWPDTLSAVSTSCHGLLPRTVRKEKRI